MTPMLKNVSPIRHNIRDLPGSFFVIEGPDGSGRSTQVALLKEWLEANGYAVQTMGLRRSHLLARNLDDLLARNTVTRLTLALMYATDIFDQIDNIILPALKAGSVVLADRYVYTLMARACVRGIDRHYLDGVFAPTPKADITFLMEVSPQVAFEREFKKSPVLSFWESGRDMSLSMDLYQSFITYQTMLRKEFDRFLNRDPFIRLNAEQPVLEVNRQIRKHIAEHLGIRTIKYEPSGELAALWRT